jgi:hypothetical protein
VYKYDSKHRPMDLDKPFSDDTIVGRTLSVEYSPVVPTTTSLDPDFPASANHIAMSKEEQSSLDAKLLPTYPRAFDQSVLADANGTYTRPITVTEPLVMLSPSGNIPSEDGRATSIMDTDMDRISITSRALSSISGFASLRSLARRIRMDRIMKASSEDQPMNDVPSSAMQWDTASSKNSLRLFGRFSMSSLSVASSQRLEALSTIEEDTSRFTAKNQLEREEIVSSIWPEPTRDGIQASWLRYQDARRRELDERPAGPPVGTSKVWLE